MYRKLDKNNLILYDDAQVSPREKVKLIQKSRGRTNESEVELYLRNFELEVKFYIQTKLLVHTGFSYNDPRNAIHFVTKLRLYYDEDHIKRLMSENNHSFNEFYHTYFRRYNNKSIKYYTLKGADKGHQRCLQHLLESPYDVSLTNQETNLISYD